MSDVNDQSTTEGNLKAAYAKPSTSKKKKVFNKIMKMMGK